MKTPSSSVRIVHLEDNPLDQELVLALLQREGLACEMLPARTREEYERLLEQAEFDLIMSDNALPGYNGRSALKLARQLRPDVPFIFVSGSLGEEAAIETMREGATDYVLKHRIERLVPAVHRALNEISERNLRQQADQRVRELAALLEKARDAIIVRDMNRAVTYWSQGATRLYGWTQEEVLGRRTHEFMYRDDPTRLDDIWQTVLEKGEWLGEIRQTTKEGKDVVVIARRNLLRDEQGHPVSVLSINTDITERKEIEAQLLRAQRMNSLGALAGGIAHDLNNVLAPIMMACELLDHECSSPSAKRMLSIMKSSAERGSSMVGQILTFARGSQSQRSTINLETHIREMARFARQTFPRAIAIDLNLGKDLRPVNGNSTQLHQVLMNLLVNARDAMPQGGRLLLAAKNVQLLGERFPHQADPVHGTFTVISVSDTGTGIPVELQNRIFEPFFTTKKLGEGTGLGLSTVQHIVKEHQGFLNLDSTPGKGTTFEVYLPALTDGPSAQDEIRGPDLPMGNREVVLVVDDEVSMLEITRETLENYNYRVITARTGSEALALFDQNLGTISVVVTGMVMPGLDGPTTIHKLREMDPHINIIAASGMADQVKDMAGSLARVRILPKPYTTGGLLVLMRDIITAPARPL